jgi:hypothetical protein
MATMTRHSSGLPAEIDPLNTRPQLPSRWQELREIADTRPEPAIEDRALAVQARLLIGAVLAVGVLLMWLLGNG